MITLVKIMDQPSIARTMITGEPIAERTTPAIEAAARTAEAAAAQKLAAEGVDFYYGRFHALKNISMTIPDREVTALIGPSGCGKSTFLRCLNRMNELIDGTRL